MKALNLILYVKAQALPFSVGHWRTIDSDLWDKDIGDSLS